jgi:glutaredoxin-like protein
MINENALEIIQKKIGQLKKPVRLIVFTRDTGCDICPDVVELARSIKAQTGKIALEIYDTVMDRDKSEQYGIKRAPALVVQGAEGQGVAFYGRIEDVFLRVLLNAIHAVSENTLWLPEDVRHPLKRLAHDVKIRVFVEKDCPLCRPVAELAVGLALEGDHIDTDIIMANDFPDLVKKYDITTLPKTIIGEDLQREGAVTESEFLEMIFRSEEAKPGLEKRCLVCGNASPDIICPDCKTRIQAEALEHKRKDEKLKKS